jgi:hypothetical protein
MIRELALRIDGLSGLVLLPASWVVDCEVEVGTTKWKWSVMEKLVYLDASMSMA